ncbi:putative acetyltransferase [Halobacteriovorax marinus SJ]|uniref:Acetyltransferase n=1 Tax=Halobacteriovorax marinus (strain ATCC BAA-682 / DSM 15412 / SJ) TaxID=862908 RepID=E1X504_HALMS|nr:GNAT family N-acetyltransferase [Halobacteriovorax marinus]CBW27230.1 putative acetyltransferase [Halobacteriovorax marinus SJ]
MFIKEANLEEHLEIIAKFQVEMAMETENLKLDYPIVKKGVQAVFEDPAKGKYYVAIDENGKCLASLLTVLEWSDWRCKSVTWIHSVYVIKEYRGKGVFKKMYHHLKELVLGSEDLAGLRLYVEKENTNAQKVYEKLEMTREHYHLYEWLK